MSNKWPNYPVIATYLLNAIFPFLVTFIIDVYRAEYDVLISHKIIIPKIEIEVTQIIINNDVEVGSS